MPLGKAIIEHSPGYKTRKKVKAAHLAILKEGVNRWNEWRRENPEIRPILYEADLKKETGVAKLELPNFSNANLINSDFRGMELVEPNFHEANLGGAKLCHATLTSANFCRTDLYETDLSDATLTKANLQGTQLAKTIFERATLKDCKIYGLSAWDLNLKEAKQENHIIRYRYKSEGQYADVSKEAQITVEDLQVAQFVYLFLDNKNIRNVIDTMTSKVVLILGRFTDERKKVLDAIRSVLPQRDLTPIVFDFAIPANRDVTETVMILAGLAKFVVADVTDATEVRVELNNIVPKFTTLPIQPLVLAGKEEPITLPEHLRKFPWVLPTFVYQDLHHLLGNLNNAVIGPAIVKRRELIRG